MKFYNLAIKNVKGNIYRYIMYYLSNAFSVMLFFIFANFIFHPAVADLHSSNSSIMVTISKALGACEVVIIIFTFFFVNYSNSTFIKSRSKEFGLLSMFGMTKNQIRKYVAYENVFVSILSILGGIVFGGVFSKLFFMAVESTLSSGGVIGFMIVPKAILITFVCFFALFQIINLFSLRKINSRTIVTQLKSTKIPKPLPKFSIILAILGVVLIAAGYVLAWFSKVAIIFTMFPILFLTILGTYFLFTQFSVAFTRMLQSNKRIFYKKTNMVALSQIIYKLRDNAKVFFLIAILGAVTLTAAGTLYAIFDQTQQSSEERIPQHMSIVEKGINVHDVIKPESLKSILNKYDVHVTKEYKIVGISGQWKSTKHKTIRFGDMLAISCGDYNNRARALNSRTIKLSGNNVEIIRLSKFTQMSSKVTFNIDGQISKKDVIGSEVARILSLDASKYDYVAVFSDSKFKSLTNKTSKLITYYGFDIDNWKSNNANNAAIEIISKIPSKYKSAFTEAATEYAMAKKSSFITMIIGTFIALLFLIATGSMIYFKLFSDIQNDKAEFIALKKMGMTKHEMNKIIDIQMIIIFFLPFIVACLHASFALKTLSDLLAANLVSIGLTVISAYLAFQILYYFIIKIVYKAQLKTME